MNTGLFAGLRRLSRARAQSDENPSTDEEGASSTGGEAVGSSADEHACPTGAVIRSGSSDRLGGLGAVFRPGGLKCVNTLSGHHSGIRAIAAQTCGGVTRIFTGSYDNTIKVWNLDDGAGTLEATLEGHTAWVRSLLPHAREPTLYSGDDSGTIRVWSTDVLEVRDEIAPPSEPAAGRRRPSGEHNGHGGGDGGNGSWGGILSLALAYEQGWLLAGAYDSTICVWAIPSYALLYRLRGHRSSVRSLVVHNTAVLLSGSYDRTIKLWDLNDGCANLGSLGTRGSVWVLAVHDGMLLGAVGDSSIKVWRMDTWAQTAALSGHRGLVLALAVFRDRLISGSDDRCIRVWRMHSWECERILTGHNGGVVGVCIVGGNLISASSDSFIKVWNSTGIQRPFTSMGIRR